MAPDVSSGYLATARDAGLMYHLDSRPFVAGEYQDEAGGGWKCMVEYCHPDLLCDGAEQLATVLCELFPATDALVVRTAGEVALSAPWRAHLTYVRFAAVPVVALPTVTVSTAGPEDDDLILGWLVRAFEAYRDEQEHRGDREEIVAAARRVLAAPDRQSYVATVDAQTVGHVTLLCDAYDDVAIGHHVELLDTLVDVDPPVRGAAIAALVSTAVQHAERVDLPLIGHVVHASSTQGKARGDAVVRSLLARGWVVDHRYWRRSRAVEGTTECSLT